MTSVMVTVAPNWYPKGPVNPGKHAERVFIAELVDKLPKMVARALKAVKGSEQIDHHQILVDVSKFDSVAKNTPEVWVVVSIAKNELYVNGTEQIRGGLQKAIVKFYRDRGTKPSRLSIDVDFTDGTGLELNENGEVVTSW